MKAASNHGKVPPPGGALKHGREESAHFRKDSKLFVRRVVVGLRTLGVYGFMVKSVGYRSGALGFRVHKGLRSSIG